MPIRDATPGDAEVIARVVTRSWQVAYRGIFDDAYLDGLDVDAAAERWRSTLASLQPTGEHLLVALHGDVVVGACFAVALGDANTDAEVRVFYLDPDWWGRGIGRELHDAMIERLQAVGVRSAQLWVEPRNVRSREIYEHLGWIDDGIEKTEANRFGRPVTTRRYSRSL